MLVGDDKDELIVRSTIDYIVDYACRNEDTDNRIELEQPATGSSAIAINTDTKSDNYQTSQNHTSI